MIEEGSIEVTFLVKAAFSKTEATAATLITLGF
jgi:hypothetical protein